MIPFVEDILTEVIETKLKWLKTNLDIIDRIFSHSSVTTRNRLKSYISNNSIKVMRGFPIDRTQVPSYVIMLGGEQEVVHYMGDFIGDDDDLFSTESCQETCHIRMSDKTATIQVKNKPLVSVNFIEYQGEIYETEFSVVDYQRGIVQLGFPVDVQNDSEVTIDLVYKETGTELYGTMFNCSYRVETWTTNGDLTVTLYHLLKWIMLSSREELAARGLVVQNLGGLDFEPAPEYFPEFVFRRALTFETQIENSVENYHSFIRDVQVHGEIH